MKNYRFNPQPYKKTILSIIREVESRDDWSDTALRKILPKYPRDGKGIFSRDQLVIGYRQLVLEKQLGYSQLVMERIKMKPTRTISGVATVTVLTRPFPCPGKCIFCPNDVRMPKSYLADEPGAQRAERNAFDPYLQTYNRLQALKNTGHNTGKVELIVLGGTWSFYPESYQIWFVKRCFDALTDFGVEDNRSKVTTVNIFEEAERIPKLTVDGRKRSYNEIVQAVSRGNTKQFFSKSEHASWEELFAAHRKNELANSRCVGLVIETRPDYINEKEVIKIRKLGATKVQIGIQHLNDKVLKLNKRGHGKTETANAIRLLRLAGFKIHAHWMPNLYGSSVTEDIKDYRRLWKKAIRPDELKIYPTSVIANTGLFEKFKEGSYKPYSHEELLQVLTQTMLQTPRYCRITRVIRDIPSTDIVAGNKLTNFRQIAELKLKEEHRYCNCIRCREIKGGKVSKEDITYDVLRYKSSTGTEYFMSFVTKAENKILGFLRLSLPEKELSKKNFIRELRNAALIREVHVYGQVVNIGNTESGRAQHLVLGKALVAKAEELAAKHYFAKIAVISAVGTREYYKKLGFTKKGMYSLKNI